MGKLLGLMLLFAIYPSVFALYREECNATVQNLLLENVLQATDNTTFYTNKSGYIMSDPRNLILTLDGCNRLCGAPKQWYKDIGPRFNVWLIPVILLIVNIEVSPFDKRKYYTILHLLGDPIDSLWSLLSKVEAWSRCYVLAQEHYDQDTSSSYTPSDVKILATILGGIEEIVGTQTDPLLIFNRYVPARKRAELSKQISITAYRLADSRTDDLVRTAFAVILYFYQTISGFLSVLGGGNSSPPRGRIGTAMFLTWLVPCVLLSNSVGGFSSRTSCFDIIRDLCEYVCTEMHEESSRSENHASILFHLLRNEDEYFKDRGRNAAVYTYIRQKGPTFEARRKNHSQLHLFIVAILPLITASFFGSCILWNTPPNGLNCRNIMIIMITIIWFLSAFLTWSIAKIQWFQEQTHWYLILTKDAVIAIPCIVVLFLSSAGLFNSCYCWSGVLYLGQSQAHVPLNANEVFEYNNRRLYPGLVAGCLSMQILIFAYIIFIGNRGLKVMRWSGKEKSSLHKTLLELHRAS